MWDSRRGRPRKLIIQIPCYNEQETLPRALETLPRQLPDVETIEWLVIDDGSEDATGEVARRHGVDHLVRLPRNRGVAHAFMAGIEASLDAGADIIVNLDADAQHHGGDIPAVIAPIVAGKAEMVVGERPIADTPHFSRWKKMLQRIGSWAVRAASTTSVPDAPSGFRAFSREAAMRLHIFSEYTYTLETIIQAGQKGMAVASVPVRMNASLRPSRVVRSNASYVRRSVLTIARIFMTYRPFAFFSIPGVVAFTAGLLLGVRYLWIYFSTGHSGHLQSLLLSALLLGTGFFLVVIGLITDLIAVNRKLLERVDWRMHRLEERIRSGDGVDTGYGP